MLNPFSRSPDFTPAAAPRRSGVSSVAIDTLLALVLLAWSVPGAGAASPYLEGIDVSHWQGPIDWPKVAAAGKKFVVMKASESTAFVDPTYATNHAGASAAGLWTSAYHFARPDASVNDAVLEADHFVAIANLGRGDLIPALDLEVTGGLGVAALQSWVTKWLGEVTAKAGVRPMIYTSPYFWKTYMGDTTSLANAGYAILWIAHWGVASPTVPAQNWAGRGWTFWQYSNCGTVSGISGCVDLDRYNGTDLARVGYSVFSLAAATSASQAKQGQTASTVVNINRTNFPSEVALDVSGLPGGTAATFSTNPTTDVSTALSITTSAVPGGTPVGTYPLTITGVGDTLTRSTKVNLVVADGIPPTVVAPTPVLQYSGRLSSATGSTSVPLRLAWSASDPSGIAAYGVQCQRNGGSWSNVSLPTYTTTAVSQALAVGVTERCQARARDRSGNTSAFAVGPSVRPSLIQQGGSGVTYSGTWRTRYASYLSGGSERYATRTGAAVTYRFWGSSVSWVAFRGPDRGSARVYVDGAYVRTISLHASTYISRWIAFARSWSANDNHTLKIVVAGTAGHPRVDVDAFVRLTRS